MWFKQLSIYPLAKDKLPELDTLSAKLAAAESPQKESRATTWIVIDASGTADIVGFGNPQQAEWINKYWRTE